MSKHLTKPAVTTASLAALLSAQSADALIITNSDLSQPGFTAGDWNNENWNIDGAGSAEARVGGYFTVFSYTSFVSSYGDIYVSNPQNGFGLAITPTNYLRNLALSSSVSGGMSFDGSIWGLADAGGLRRASEFTSGEDGYVGFRFTPDTTTYYGWARVNFNAATYEISVLEWAYDDSGNSIQVGQTSVPEPAETAVGLGALALGAVGLRRWRKQRKAA